MPRDKRPPLGSYDRYVATGLNGMVKKFQRWRKKRMRMQRDSRRRNRRK